MPDKMWLFLIFRAVNKDKKQKKILQTNVSQLLQTRNHHAKSADMLKAIESPHNPEMVSKNVKNVQHHRWIEWER